MIICDTFISVVYDLYTASGVGFPNIRKATKITRKKKQTVELGLFGGDTYCLERVVIVYIKQEESVYMSNISLQAVVSCLECQMLRQVDTLNQRVNLVLLKRFISMIFMGLGVYKMLFLYDELLSLTLLS